MPPAPNFDQYKVVIKSLPSDITENEVLQLVKGYALSSEPHGFEPIGFKTDLNTNKKLAFVNFQKWDEAHNFVISNNKKVQIRDNTYPCTMHDKTLKALSEKHRKLYI